MTTRKPPRKPTGKRLASAPVAVQEAPATPEQQRLERELRHINAELDWPVSDQYKRSLTERKAAIEKKLAKTKGQEA